MKVLLDHMKAAIIGCRQEKTGLTKDGKSLVGPIDPLVAKQLLRQGHVGATTPPPGSEAMGLASCSPYGSVGRNDYRHCANRGKHGTGGTNSNGDWLSVDRQKENGQKEPPAKSGRSGRPVQRKWKVVSRGTVKRGLWPRPVLATCGQGRLASPELLTRFIIFRVAPLGRVALTCPRPLRARRDQPPLRGRALCVEN